MNKPTKYLRTLLFVMLGVLLFFLVSGCSSESDNNTQTSNSPKQTQSETESKSSELAYSFDHPHDESVTNMEKHKFQHQFADQCVERELRSYPEAKNNKKTIKKTCMCIAGYMMKDLTAVEAEKFLDENKNTRSLQIRFNNAAYFCAKK